MTAALHNPHGTAFGLMDKVYGPGTAAALRDSGGPWEVFYHDGLWTLATAPTWHAAAAYRLKPQPPKPWSGWVEFDDAGFAFRVHEDSDPVATPMGHRLIRVVEDRA
jgi:hypothetical protein